MMRALPQATEPACARRRRRTGQAHTPRTGFAARARDAAVNLSLLDEEVGVAEQQLKRLADPTGRDALGWR